MPFTRISLIKGKSPEYLQAVSNSLHDALADVFDVPADDRFQVIQQVEANELIFDRHYMGGPRTDDYMLINVVAGKPRSRETKRAFFQRAVEKLTASPGVRPEDVMIVIQTANTDEWSLSSGKQMIIGETP
jgi:phenylpyruvate tautomerase PptA (4-oxalocrotonate tautomerase family)